MDMCLERRDLDHFGEHGYVVVKGLLDPDEDLQPVSDEYSELLDDLADSWLKDGQLRKYDRDAPIAARLMNVMEETDGRCFQFMDISLPLDDDIVEDTPMHLGPAVFGLLTNRRLLDAVEAFVGSEIYANPVQHVRIKPPERCISSRQREHTLISRTFWHEDLAVITSDADQSNIVSVWIPMVESTEENGCLVVVPGSHRQGLTRHCRTATSNGIPEPLIGDERLPLPMEPGDVLFLTKLTKHASLPNVSDDLRWSFDLRYNPVGEPTGRPWFPGFVARSRARPETALTKPEAWANSWRQARTTLASKQRPDYNRWDPADPLCA